MDILLFFLFRVLAMLQSRLTRAAGHWLHHIASMLQPRKTRLLSRTSTSAAELYYLHHTRSCAATTTGNKGGHLGQSCALEVSGADFTDSLEIAQDVALTWLTPLELAACFHLASACTHQTVHTDRCEPNHCWVRPSTRPSAQEMSAVAIALTILLLAIMDWHVPRVTKWQPITCRVLTAMCMYALRADTACTVTALLLPTFGKRSQAQASTARKRSTTASHATEQTEAAAMSPTTHQGDDQGNPETEHNTGSTQEQTSTPSINSLEDLISIIGQHSGEGEAYRTLHLDAEKLRNAKQHELRTLCKPWGVTLHAKNAQGLYSQRGDEELKLDIRNQMIQRARELQRQRSTATHRPATELANAEFDVEGAVAEVMHDLDAISNETHIMARVVDHACGSQDCISQRIVAMCREAKWQTLADLSSDQPLDACGYIAADAVCRLRDIALAEGSNWHRERLPDYSQLECIHRGNRVLNKIDDDRILDTDQVNRLVRHYTFLDQSPQAAEEWWGGAIAIDHFITGLTNSVREICASSSQEQHRWRAWVVNTQTSGQLGSHWFTVAVGIQEQLTQSIGEQQESTASSQCLGTAAQMLQSTVGNQASVSSSQNLVAVLAANSHGTSDQTREAPDDPANFANLFDSPDPVLSAALCWAHANAMRPAVADWLEACSQWDAAVASKDYQRQKRRRQLCKDHNIPCTKIVKSNGTLDAAMEYVRGQLSNRIQQVRATMQSFQLLLQSKGPVAPRRDPEQKRAASAADAAVQRHRKEAKVSDCKLESYFKLRVAGDGPPDVEALHIPDVATDVISTYLRLHTKRDTYAEDKDFHIVTNALSELRGYVNERRLHKIITDPPKTPKTIRQRFKEGWHGTVSFSLSPSSADAGGAQQSASTRQHISPSHTWRTYYVKLLVLAQARRWLSATERLDPIEDAPPTPKTNFQLADAIKHPKTRDYAPFGHDFEDSGAYSLLVHAEIHNCKDHNYGSFSMPRQELPYTYRQLQELILERRRLQQLSPAAEDSSRQLVQTVEDLVAKLCAFASDGIVLRHIIAFALPPKKRAAAAEVTPKVASSTTYISPEHAKDISDATTEHTKDTSDEAKRPNDRCKTAGDATERVSQQRLKLKQSDDSHKTSSHDVTLSQRTAKAMADSFFKFVEQEHLQTHLNLMSAGQILVLCLFHSRLSWQKGKPLELHDRDQYWIPKLTYTPASQVKAPSPPHFVQRILSSATEHVPPEMQPPRTCCLCGKGFIDTPALWKHCDEEHHSWAEAVKRILWSAEQLEAIPLLSPDKRRIIQNFTDALTYSKPAEAHFGRDKVCMRQLVGCATCARVSWIDKCFPCHLFQNCPDALRPREESDGDDAESEAAAEESSDEEASATKQRRGRLLKDEDGFYVINADKINKLLDVNKYIEAWPLIPKEKLHASSVQHPSHPEYRWLLNTRRVPVQAPSLGSAATEQELPKCAGVGIKDRPLWLCKSCTTALCRPEPIMPFFALANWNWGGRLHPLYYNFSIATKAKLV